MEDKAIDLVKLIFRTEKDMLLGKLASTIAHEINNPIMVITNLISLLLDEIKTKGTVSIDSFSDYYKDLIEILNSCDRIANITKTLSTLRKETIKKPDVVDINDLIIRTLRFLEPFAIKSQTNLTFDLKADNSLSFVVGVDIQQVLMRLFQNSLFALRKKYMDDIIDAPNKKVIKITVSREFLSTDFIKKHFTSFLPANQNQQEGEYIIIEIYDDGIGMSEKIQRNLGQPFFTTKKTHIGKLSCDDQNLGLGIHYCVSILKENRGFLRFNSLENIFSCFYIYLPLYNPEMAEKPVDELDEKSVDELDEIVF